MANAAGHGTATSRPRRRSAAGQAPASRSANFSRVAAYARRHPNASVPTIVDKLGIPERTVRRYLQTIRDEA